MDFSISGKVSDRRGLPMTTAALLMRIVGVPSWRG
jgi:hypothetical protein